MIFEFKSIHEITDEEIASLVRNGEGERQHLEFKATYERGQQLELLRDVSAFANSGGGYLIVGIGDDGNGNANGYRSLSEEEAQRIRESMAALCHDHIKDRIEGLEVVIRVVEGHQLVAVRIPDTSKKPHMVTLDRRTDFWYRNHNGKREMDISQIRAAFQDDFTSQQLNALLTKIDSLSASIDTSRSETQLLSKSVPADQDSDLYLKQLAQKTEASADQNKQSLFWLGIAPYILPAESLEIDNTSIRSLLAHPPDCRPYGWNLEKTGRIDLLGGNYVGRGNNKDRHVILFDSGVMEFQISVDSSFCWPQKEQEFQSRPRFNPIPVAEFPLSFLSLYKAIATELNLAGPFIVALAYFNIKGFLLPPGRADSTLFDVALPGMPEIRPFKDRNMGPKFWKIDKDFSLAVQVFEMVRYTYACFGMTRESVPYFDQSKQTFQF